MAWTIRPAAAGDHTRIAEVVDVWWGGRSLAHLLQPLFLQNFSSSSIVVEQDGELIGFLVGFVSGDDPTVAYVHFVGVSPASRGSGLWRAMYERFVEQVAPWGVRELRCVTSAVNETSIGFHEAIGFSVVGRRPDAHVDGGEYVELRRPVDPYRGESGPRVRWPPAELLEGEFVQLRKTVAADASALFHALDDPLAWTHLTVPQPGSEAHMAELVEAYRGSMLPWTVTLRRPVRGCDAGAVVGWSSYLDVSRSDGRLEIGATSYAPAVWGSVVNAECKLLLLSHAFDDLRFSRVQLKTDLVNRRSQDAIARLGAVREGVLRRYQRRPDGTLRHTVLYSITSDEWPRVRADLQRRLEGG